MPSRRPGCKASAGACSWAAWEPSSAAELQEEQAPGTVPRAGSLCCSLAAWPPGPVTLTQGFWFFLTLHMPLPKLEDKVDINANYFQGKEENQRFLNLSSALKENDK